MHFCAYKESKDAIIPLLAFGCVLVAVVSNSLPPHGLGSAVYGILQARILEWIPIPFPGDLPDSGIKPGLLRFRQILHHLSRQDTGLETTSSLTLVFLSP